MNRCRLAVLMLLLPSTNTVLSFRPSLPRWTPSSSSRAGYHRISSRLSSTPFEADLYDSPSGEEQPSSLSVDPNTKLVIGLNKYSHDTSLCAANAQTGELLFAASKERLTRRKHDAGNVVLLVEACLDALNLDLDSIETVVANNHHHRIAPLEARPSHMEWEAGQRINGGMEDGYEDPENLVGKAKELSHHLAHAYSTACQAPFETGMCVVMDGMGETFRAMKNGLDDTNYISDLEFGLDTFECIPSDIGEQASKCHFDWREAESVYVFEKSETGIDIKPVFKRFTRENSPPVLYNHGFENMDSLGALYSRASSHIFGDWNACGKVMGLAPWANHSWDTNGTTVSPILLGDPIMEGTLYKEGEEGIQFNRSALEGQPFIARSDPDLYDEDGSKKKLYDFDDGDDENSEAQETVNNRLPVSVALEAIAVAHRIQIDLETVAMDFVGHFKESTGKNNLCLAGGVALNSVLNGRLARELGFEQTYVSPYPGDDGIAVGCCAFGLFGNKFLQSKGTVSFTETEQKMWKRPFSPYTGSDPSDADIKDAIKSAEPWLEVEEVQNEDERLMTMARLVEVGAVIAWYRGRSEMGPRALGHRSILADPRKKGLVRFINEHVKSRESFRPFAPSVLAEEAREWFDLGNGAESNVSPYMSMTAMVHEDKRPLIPAVTHVDGSSRLQTVSKEDEPLYHKFISNFFELTGIPMVLNTSFNTLPSEPIVESPHDALRTFLYSMGSIEVLVMGNYVIRRRKADLQKLLGEGDEDGIMKIEPVYIKRAGSVTFQSTFDLDSGVNEEEDMEPPVTRVRMPARPMHGNKNEWFELLDELEGEILSVCDGQVTLNDIMAEYSATDPSESALDKEKMDETQNLLQNIVMRIVRLYEHTFIRW